MVKSAILFAAPHRLLFLTGIVQLAATMLWWTVALAGIHFGTVALPTEDIPASLLHAPILIYLVLPPLFFGFLLTVFPRWMGYPDLERRAYAPVAIGYALSAVLCWAGLFVGRDILLTGAFGTAFLASLWGAFLLASIANREVRDSKSPTWHGWSILAAFACGIVGQIALLAFMADLATDTLPFANRIGLWAFVLPVFFTVCHRMVPFFAGNVVEGYVRWRPFWLLTAFWVGTVLLIAAEVTGRMMLLSLGSAFITTVTAMMVLKWWPRAKAPALLWVLIIGFAWAPIGYALAFLGSIGIELGRAPEHALTIGFASSILVAMVTRVTHGHSGRPLSFPAVAWIAFVGMQTAALARIAAAVRYDNPAWLLASAIIFVACFAPWMLRNGAIYLQARIDGKAG
ncbi:NnrS family protein [Sphingorhabdus sp. IMCC26285]|uniref:NnrS family protein n=1 Tax=Sphingorhabdus profundilacus TaxID=2509718 RepID=A0A6I4LUM6_9SPHN|nr:NnrS family protein [Sphingorhabdus profundilacus]MVZ97197.1 NnrS family protein [Sphingorhabdus profundilacus]